MKPLCKITIGLLIIANIFACEEDDVNVNPPVEQQIVVQFGENETVSENVESKEITIKLSKPAAIAGEIILKVIAEDNETFQTIPEVIDDELKITVAKDANNATFNFLPNNNSILEANKDIQFKLLQVSSGFDIGNKDSLTVTIIEDEDASYISFVDSLTSITENNTVRTSIKLALTSSAPAECSVTIQLSNWENAKFTTDPAFNENGQIILPVVLGTSNLSFDILPTNNNVLNGHFEFNASIVAVSGAILKGAKIKTFINILDDELIGKAKSYESAGGNWKSRKIFVYDENGKIEKVN
ncbi:hypothetical protein [Chondrinema litorale]|uniref:hypothetical protein n=1 Tax=Chondrinema litorale TaxID=2994555 RepID=UPI0025431CEE|nr:hypothetical protein [Chondrinema litorale]UZR96547.1 hypothetical protein OQ292_20575 [Chondrinema litorale]